MWKFYRPEQGKYVRWGLLGIVVLFAVLASKEFYYWFCHVGIIEIGRNFVSIGHIGAVLIMGISLIIGIYYIFVKPKSSQFFIEVESELRKVSWSSWNELLGATYVVIGLVVFLSIFVFVVDLIISSGIKLLLGQ